MVGGTFRSLTCWTCRCYCNMASELTAPVVVMVVVTDRSSLLWTLPLVLGFVRVHGAHNLSEC